ncbi:MAG: hypothetical protein NW215_00555 [Hyphomicrobiales bacterium]|nr:hypothetical protein [Hyphomicrobiales bacterium]
MPISFFRQYRTNNDYLKRWKQRQKEQLKGLYQADFHPVEDQYLAAQGLKPPYYLTILPLRHTEHELWAGDLTSPSTILNEACRFRQEMLDQAIAVIPTPVLIYLETENNWWDEPQDQFLSMLQEYTSDWRHSYVRKYSALTFAYVQRLSPLEYRLFQEALSRLSWPGLIEDNAVTPAALERFPSLAARKSHIEAQYALMQQENRVPDPQSRCDSDQEE